MTSLWKLKGYLRSELATLFVALLAMAVLAFATALYAVFAGPALQFLFTEDARAVLFDGAGGLRPGWKVLPHAAVAWLTGMSKEQAVWLLPSCLVATAIIKGLAQAAQFFLLGQTSQRLLQRLRTDVGAALLRQSPTFFQKHPQGDILSRVSHDAPLVEQAFFYGLAPLAREPLVLLSLLSYMAWSQPWLTLSTMVSVPLVVWPLVRFARWLKTVSQKSQGVAGSLLTVVSEMVSGIRVLQLFGQERQALARLEAEGQAYLGHMRKSYLIRALRTPTMEILGALALATLLGVLGFLVQRRYTDPAGLLSFFIAVVMIYDPLKKLGQVADYLAVGEAAAERLLWLRDHPPSVRDVAGASTLAPFRRELRLDQVSFAYDQEPVLDHVDLTVEYGETVALVGASGSGKTTLTYLLCRFVEPKSGRITIDGTDIRTVSLASLRAQLSWVGQEPFLFRATIAENIALGRAGASRQDVMRAARAAYAEEFIRALPGGYDTQLGESGGGLSGGQKQRIAIARAFLKDAPILLLDEATSHLDPQSEEELRQACAALMAARTNLVIAHRQSTVRNAQRIVVLKGGKVVASGTHEELSHAQSDYTQLFGQHAS